MGTLKTYKTYEKQNMSMIVMAMLTMEKEWGDTGIMTDNAIITRAYYPNTTANIMSKVATEKVVYSSDENFTVNESAPGKTNKLLL